MSGIWDFIVIAMACIQEIPAEVTSDRTSVNREHSSCGVESVLEGEKW